jgi:excisionase family DNA binding protein
LQADKTDITWVLAVLSVPAKENPKLFTWKEAKHSAGVPRCQKQRMQFAFKCTPCHILCVLVCLSWQEGQGMDRYLTTGQVAQELKISNQTVRNYCESGVINATKSAGGHYRVEPAELERLKSLESLPAVARATLSGNNTRLPVKRNPHELLAEPSIDAIESAEDAYKTERELATDTHQLARKRIRREGVELDDWFEAREQARRKEELEAQRREQEIYQKQIRQRQEQTAAEERRRFERKWLSYAVEHKPWDSPDDYAVVIRPEVMTTLSELHPDEDSYTVERLIEGAIARGLRPWRSAQERLKAIDRAVDALPWSMRADDNWKARSRLAAAAAVANVRAGALRVTIGAAFSPGASEKKWR